MAYISRASNVSTVGCRSPDLCCETRRSAAINIVGTDCPRHYVTRAVTAQREGHKHGWAFEDRELAQIHPMASMLEDSCCTWGIYGERTHKRENLN